MLSMQRPRPSMLMAIWRSANSPVNFSLVNCDPWSLLKMSGRPRRSARFSASTQNSTSIVSDSDQLSTNRFSRFVLSWSLSLTMEVEFCVEALKRALRRGRPDIFNSDQGSQFTSEKFTGELAERQIAISMDGRGRCMDNIFVERLWRSLKYEEVYLKDYA